MRLRPWYRAPLAMGLLVALGVFAYWGIWLPLHSTGYDFTGPYEAAYALAHHAALQVYDVPMQRAFNMQVLHLPDGPSDFRWTPPSAALLIPLGLLPYRVARVIWWALSLAALLGSVWLLAPCVSITATQHGRTISTWTTGLILFAVAALAQPVTDSLRLGQSTTFLLLGFALVAYGEVRGRPVVAGLGLAIAILDKLFPGVLLAYFLWRGNYRLCIATIAVVAIAMVATLPLTGVAMYGAFVEALRSYSSQPNAGPVNLSLYHALIVASAALFRQHSEPTTGFVPVLSLLVCVALFGTMLLAQGAPDILRRRRLSNPSPTVRGGSETPQHDSHAALASLFATSWAVCSLLLVEPIVWIFYYVLLLVPLAWLLAVWPMHERGSLRWWWMALVGVVLALAVFPLDPRTATPMSAAFVLGICAHPAGLALVWIAHAGYRASRRRGAGDQAVLSSRVDAQPAHP